ncbi:Amyloid-beta A4 precursor protein-binding family B member 1 [Halotydeus destructor]|nr:Amyloid-beta A4 precursor protein-binding family B member 1 [Halotydeus destructor]
MDSLNETAANDTESAGSFNNYENPNFRKLYATLSVTTMMGCDPKEVQDGVNSGGLGGKLYPDIGALDIGDDDQDGGGDHEEALPPGWELQEDDNGPYYWHIPSGTIQRDKPTRASSKEDSINYYKDGGDESLDITKESNETDMLMEPETDFKVTAFIVQSLGWMEFDELLLTPSTSSKAIQRCIIELNSRAAHRTKDEMEKLFLLKIENSSLKLNEIPINKLINKFPISLIRVWGVNDNNDFAFVARDHEPSVEDEGQAFATPSPTSAVNLKCHVFHCYDYSEPEAAQKIANILRDEVTRLSNQGAPGARNGHSSATTNNKRPQHLYIDDCIGSPLPTPSVDFVPSTGGPHKTIVAKYLARTPVLKPVGVNILNDAIEKVKLNIDFGHRGSPSDGSDQGDELCQEKIFNRVCFVRISQSAVTAEDCDTGEIILNFRVRFLSFMGIGKNSVKNCGFIVQAGDNKYIAHCFECEPDSGMLCKNIEAACKLRYQKCLDAHKQHCSAALGTIAKMQGEQKSNDKQLASSATLASVKNVLTKFWKPAT